MGQSHGGAARKRRISLTSNESELSTSKDRGWGYFFRLFLLANGGLNSEVNSIPVIWTVKPTKLGGFIPPTPHTRLCFFFLLNFFTDRFSKKPIQRASSMSPRLSQNRSRPDLEKRLSVNGSLTTPFFPCKGNDCGWSRRGGWTPCGSKKGKTLTSILLFRANDPKINNASVFFSPGPWWSGRVLQRWGNENRWIDGSWLGWHVGLSTLDSTVGGFKNFFED